MSTQVEQLEMTAEAQGNALSNSPAGRIIVVDDEPKLKDILVAALSAEGFDVAGFSFGHQALEELRQRDFDLLLTDLMMPEMDGIALLEAALQIDPQLMGIIMTGQGTIQTAVEAMKVGAFDYVLKPFQLQTVMPALTRAIGTRRLRMENLQLRETVAIYDLCQTIAFTLDPQTVISKLADAAFQQTDADEVSVLLPTSDGRDELYVAAVRGERRVKLLGERVPLAESISGWVARERKPLMLEGEINDDRFRSLWPHPEIRSAISIPMEAGNKLVGTININAVNRLRPFTLGQMKALSILAGTAAAALESASAYAQVQRAEENYRSIFENAVEGVFQSTPDGRFLTANPAMARMLGYDSPEELIANITDVTQQLHVNPKSHAEAARIEKERGILQGYEFEAYRKDGQKIWLSLNRRTVRDESGVEIYREGSVEDISERRRADEEKLQLTAQIVDQRQRLNNVVASVPGIVWEAWGQPDAATQRINFVSEHVETMLGYSVKEWLSTPNFWLTIVHPDDRERAAAEAAAIFAGGKNTNTQEFRWLGKDGRVLWVQANSAVITDDQGQPAGMRGVTIDITERKRAEEALRQSEERYRFLFASNPMPMWVYDLETLSFLEVNDAAVFRYGYSREEFLAMTIKDIRPREDIPALLASVSQVHGGLIEAGVWKHRKKGGQTIDVEITSHELIFAGRRAELVLPYDVTERRRNEQTQVRRSAHLALRADVSAALSNSGIPLRSILELCTEAIVQDLGAAFARIWTLNRGEKVLELQASAGIYTHIDGPHARVAVGTYKIGRIAEQRRPHISNDVQTDPEVSDQEWAVREGMIAFAGYPLIVEDRLVGVIALFARQELANDTLDALASIADIISQGIERKRAEEALHASEEQLRQSQKLEAIGMLAGGIAHDFNNLLTVIGGYSDLTLMRLNSEDPLHRNISEVKKAAERAAGLTRQLLAFSRKQVLQPKVFDLNTVVSELEKMLQRLIGEDVELRTVFEPELGSIKADPGQIEQIVMNLAINARDAMPQGGKLTIETMNVSLDDDYAKSHIAVIPGPYVMLAVSDTGSGMDRQTQARIFEPFFTTKETGKGTGLGLSTVYGIVKQSGGNLWVYSEVGKGTSFKVYLPRVGEGAPKSKRQATEGVVQGSETVLLAEDEEMVRKFARQVLEIGGYQVLEAANGGAALLICERHKEPIHLLITDVIMPEMSGRELAGRLAQLRPEMKVLYMSGYTDDAIVRQGILDEAASFIQKPFPTDALVRKVRAVLDAPA